MNAVMCVSCRNPNKAEDIYFPFLVFAVLPGCFLLNDLSV